MTTRNYPEDKSKSICKSAGTLSRELSKVFSAGKSLPIFFYRLCRLLLVGLISPIIFLCFSTANAQSNRITSSSEWIGSYYFSEMAQSSKRRSSRDVVPSASYDITIEEKEKKLVASFSANGVQLFEAYYCSVIANGSNLEFHFQKLGSPEIQNFRKFKKGDLLFTLSKTGNGKTVKYLFQPAAYKIVRLNSSKQKTTVYFEKSQV